MSSNVSLTLEVSQADLPALMALAAKSGVSINTIASKLSTKEKKEKKVKDPNAPKKPANDWILFTQRARDVLIAGGCELKGIGVCQQFCSMLKESMRTHTVTDAKGKEKQMADYASITDSDLLARFKLWAPSEKSKESNAAAAPAAPVAKPKEKRASKKAEAAATAWTETADIGEFTPIKINGKDYLVNCRGDLMDANGDWKGHYDAKTKKIDTTAKRPSDLEEE